MKQSTRIYILCSYVSLFWASAFPAPLLSPKKLTHGNLGSVYAKLAELYLPSLISENKPKKSAVPPQESEEEFSQEELIELGFLMLAEKHDEPSTTILSPTGYQDLEIYSGNQKVTRSLFAKIDNTITIIGKLSLAKLLFCPTTNVQELLNRQTIVKELVDNTELSTTLEQHLTMIKKNESTLLWFWKKLSDEVQESINQFYFSSSALTPYNTNETILNYLTLSTTIGTPIYQRTWQFMNELVNAIIKSFVRHNELNSHYLYNHFIGKLNPVRWMEDIKEANPNFNNAWIEGLLYLFWFQKKYQEISSLYNTIKEAHKHLQQFAIIHHKMSNLAQYIAHMKAIIELIAPNQSIQHALPQVKQLQIFFEVSPQTINPTVQKLATNLTSKTFSSSPSLFNNNGKILASFKMMQETKGSMVDFFEMIGQLDAYLSIAKLYRSSQHQSTLRYSFATYTSSPSPQITLEKYWTPFISSTNLVTNSIDLGTQDHARNLIITGPNAAGKSTVLKTIVLCLLLAQTIGIVPAQRAVISPFSKITTYLNICDTIGKESLFQAEMRRTQKLITELKELQAHERAFIILDEIFTATNTAEGIAGAYGIAKKIAKYDQCCCLIATHYLKLTELEQDTHGIFKNYHVHTCKNSDSTFTYPYTLEPGINTQNIALDLLKQEGFDDDVLQEAYRIFNQP